MKILLLLIAIVGLYGCSGKATDPTAGMSAAELYSLAKGYLEEESYTLAIEHYEILESRYPFGVFATQAQLDVAYAYYLYDEPESATAAVERFIKLHPRHPRVDYAYYLRGLINFGLRQTILDKFYTREPSDYDLNTMLQSYRDFQTLINRFPDSEYSRDAVKRLVYLRNQLALGELKTAEFYLRRGAWVAAANRAKTLLKRYQGSDSIKRALQIQMLAYRQLKLDDLAEDTRRVLVFNYGESAADVSLDTEDS